MAADIKSIVSTRYVEEREAEERDDSEKCQVIDLAQARAMLDFQAPADASANVARQRANRLPS